LLTSASKLLAEPRTRSAERRRAIPRALFLRLLAACELLSSLATCAGLLFAAQWLQLRLGHSAYTLHQALAASVFIAALTAALVNRKRVHHTPLMVNPVRETAAEVQASLLAFVLLLAARWLVRPELLYAAILLALLLTPIALMLQRGFFAPVLRKLNQRGYGTENVVIYGASSAGRRIASAFQVFPRLAFVPVAVIDDDFRSVDECRLHMAFRNASPLPVQCVPVTPGLLQSFECDLLLIAAAGLSAEQEARLEAVAAQAGSRVARLSEASLYDSPSRELLDLDDLVITHKTPPPAHVTYGWGKRIIDLLTSSLLLVLLSPFFVFIALLIRLTSRGPALFVQKRVGLDGHLFRMYKFRSMSCRARRYECSPKTADDPRITTVGRFLRRTSLDELPQLINVLLGEMSLVGPRPEMPFITRRYDDHQRKRLQVTPGITGLWQLSSDRPSPIHENLHHDLFYIRHRSLTLDLAIVLHTLFFAMRRGV
jgi:exopolysaccharide biosynthesis polyprenyl glycosylphosphotransferase